MAGWRAGLSGESWHSPIRAMGRHRPHNALTDEPAPFSKKLSKRDQATWRAAHIGTGSVASERVAMCHECGPHPTMPDVWEIKGSDSPPPHAMWHRYFRRHFLDKAGPLLARPFFLVSVLFCSALLRSAPTVRCAKADHTMAHARRRVVGSEQPKLRKSARATLVLCNKCWRCTG